MSSLEKFFYKNLSNPGIFNFLNECKLLLEFSDEMKSAVVDCNTITKYFPNSIQNSTFFYILILKHESILAFVDYIMQKDNEGATKYFKDVLSCIYLPLVKDDSSHFSEHNFSNGVENNCEICLNIQNLIATVTSDADYKNKVIYCFLQYASIITNLSNHMSKTIETLEPFMMHILSSLLMQFKPNLIDNIV